MGLHAQLGVVSESVCKIHISNDIIWANVGALSGRKGHVKFWGYR